jgi:hypothetical protein
MVLLDEDPIKLPGGCFNHYCSLPLALGITWICGVRHYQV